MIVLSTLLMPAMIIRSLAGLAADVPHRPAALHGLHHVGLDLLPRQPERALPQDLVQDLPLPAVPHVARRRPHHHQHQGRPRSPLRPQNSLRPHAQVPRPEEGRSLAGQEVPQAPRHHPLDRAGHRLLLRLRRSGTPSPRRTTSPCRSSCSSSSATGIPACSASSRASSNAAAPPATSFTKNPTPSASSTIQNQVPEPSGKVGYPKASGSGFMAKPRLGL